MGMARIVHLRAEDVTNKVTHCPAHCRTGAVPVPGLPSAVKGTNRERGDTRSGGPTTMLGAAAAWGHLSVRHYFRDATRVRRIRAHSVPVSSVNRHSSVFLRSPTPVSPSSCDNLEVADALATIG